ncbi:MAG: putative metal-binding motif-containing protein [Deltaproteobacteria bacterium]
MKNALSGSLARFSLIALVATFVACGPEDRAETTLDFDGGIAIERDGGTSEPVDAGSAPVDAGPTVVDDDADGYGDDVDCDDHDPARNPGAAELCNGVDDNCDSEIDEGVRTTFYADTDEDGYGALDVSVAACEAPPMYVASAGDCDDADANVNPDATEICDGVDNDCDSTTSEDGLATFFDPSGAHADVTEVLTTGTAETPALVQTAAPGRVNICSGTYYLGLEALHSLEIVGIAGAEATILDGGGQRTVLSVTTDDVLLEVEGVTIRNGEATNMAASAATEELGLVGGGLYCDAAASVQVRDAIVENNHAESGGGVFGNGCTVLLDSTIVRDNTADIYGGGVTVTSRALRLVDAVITRNAAGTRGGGILCWGRDANAVCRMYDTLVSQNSAGHSGAGFYINAYPGRSVRGTCRGTTEAAYAGMVDNYAGSDTGTGARFYAGAGATWTFESTDCDWGTAAAGDDNEGDDIRIAGFGSGDVYTDFGDNETFACDQMGCQ